MPAALVWAVRMCYTLKVSMSVETNDPGSVLILVVLRGP
jgi:hypothetical protein